MSLSVAMVNKSILYYLKTCSNSCLATKTVIRGILNKTTIQGAYLDFTQKNFMYWRKSLQL